MIFRAVDYSSGVNMKEFLNKGIKEVIELYPKIGGILDEYNIGCAPCSVGTCLLKDIVEIHNLSSEEEQELMARIAKVIYPEREIKLPGVKKKPVISKEAKYSPPIKKLVDEHLFIKRWLALIPQVIDSLDLESRHMKQLILDGIDFIRTFADKYHHAKEEDILFKYFDESLDIIKVIREDHESARAHIRAIIKAIDNKDKNLVIKHLRDYQELLTEHIKKEDEILYPWMDRNLSITQTGDLFSKFSKVDEEFKDIPKKSREFIERAEKEFNIKEVIK